MNTLLPADPLACEPHLSQRAAVAVGLAPILVLLALTLVIGDLLPPGWGIGGVVASVVWLVFEMHRYQRAIGRHDEAAAADLDALRM